MHCRTNYQQGNNKNPAYAIVNQVASGIEYTRNNPNWHSTLRSSQVRHEEHCVLSGWWSCRLKFPQRDEFCISGLPVNPLSV
jgi:hypothetical protein